MNLAFIDTKGLEFLFISSEASDLDLANDILKEKNVNTDELEKLIDYLNKKYTEWHFFLRDCRVQKARSFRTN